MEQLLSTRAASQRLIEANLLPSETRTRILKFISYSDQIINYKKTVKNDIVLGQQNTALNTPLAYPLSDGYANQQPGNGRNVLVNLPYQYQNVGGGWPEQNAREETQVCDDCGVASDDPLISCLCTQPAYPDDNPKTAFGAKKLPLEVVPPSAVAALAEAFADGAKKYGPYNWREKSISSSVYYGACLRHIQAWWDGEDNAEDSGVNHLHHAMACLAMLVDSKSVGKLNDNRPPKGAASQMQKDWIKKHE